MIPKYSVKRPYTVLVAVVLVIVLGVVSLTRMTTDLLPAMNLPYVIVVTTDVGASPEEVEKDVTSPIEAAMATTSNINNVSSMSYDNYSMVILEYEQSTNMDSAMIEIQQQLDQLTGQFPDSAGSPVIMQIDPDMMPVMIASADVDGMDQAEVSNYVDNELLPLFESIEGARVSLFWSRVRESNPPPRLGKPLYYRCTNPAVQVLGIISSFLQKCNRFLAKTENRASGGGPGW